MRTFFKLSYLCTLVFLLGGVISPMALAQEDDFFIEEPSDFDEPEDFDVPPPPDDFDTGGGSPGGFIPPQIRSPLKNNIGRPSGGGGRGSSLGRAQGGPVEFYLVDPPLYWKKKPRPKLPKPKAP